VEAKARLHARVQEKTSAADKLECEIMEDAKKIDRMLQVGIQRLEQRLADWPER
jgi:hypothetical protein